MSEWRGLHNHEHHFQASAGSGQRCMCCGQFCISGAPCRCCLAVEVERLTAARADRDQRIEAALALHELHVCTGLPFGDDPCGIVVTGACRYEGHCRTCRTPAPCLTAQALRGESDE